jgi:hypothetical protein
MAGFLFGNGLKVIFGGGQKEILKSFSAEYIHRFTMTTAATSTNAQKMAQLERALAELLAATLKRGFFGTAAVEVSVQDGTIQHIRRKVEQIEK